MLAVTAVNGCRYCSYYHTKQALKSGITAKEINSLLAGDVANCPQDEAVAVAYGQTNFREQRRLQRGHLVFETGGVRGIKPLPRSNIEELEEAARAGQRKNRITGGGTIGAVYQVSRSHPPPIRPPVYGQVPK